VALLAELAERDASGEKARIYAELKRLGGVPMVALIFRHLATRAGVLEWAWEAIGPAWRAGVLQETAWRIAREEPLAPIATVPFAALAPLGVEADDLRAMHAVLEAYNRANPENMLSMLCLLRLFDGARASTPLGERAWTPPPAPVLALPMVDVATMSPELSALLDVVAAPGEPGGARVIQSLYRHIAQRPAFLALCVTLLRQRLDDGSIDAATASVVARMNAAADEIVRGLQAPRVPDPAVRAVVERFSGGVIPQMIVVGRLLEVALPAG
jgi:hypothetical protein